VPLGVVTADLLDARPQFGHGQAEAGEGDLAERESVACPTTRQPASRARANEGNRSLAAVRTRPTFGRSRKIPDQSESDAGGEERQAGKLGEHHQTRADAEQQSVRQARPLQPDPPARYAAAKNAVRAMSVGGQPE